MTKQQMIDAAIAAHESGEWGEWLKWLREKGVYVQGEALGLYAPVRNTSFVAEAFTAGAGTATTATFMFPPSDAKRTYLMRDFGGRRIKKPA